MKVDRRNLNVDTMKPETEAACYQAIAALARANELLDRDVKEVITSENPADIVRYYADLREQAETMREQTAVVAALEQNLSYNDIPRAFDVAGVSSVKVPGYGLVTLKRRWNCSMIDKMRAFAYLRMHDQGGMIIETVPAPTLGAWARSETEEKGREPPDDIFKTSINRFVSLTRSKATPSPAGYGK